VFKGVSVILQKFNPSTIFSTELLLRIKVSKGFMIRVKDKFLRQKIMSPMAQRLHYSVEFLVIGRVIQSSTYKLFTEEDNEVPFLT